MAIELHRDNYEDEVLKSEGAILVDFWGPQCRPCLALMPAVEKLEKAYAGKLRVAKVHAAQNRMLCARLRVLSLPTFILYRGGQEVKRLTGEEISGSDLNEAVKLIVD